MPLIGHSGKTATGIVGVLGLALAMLAALALLAAVPAMAAAPGAGPTSPAAAPVGGGGPAAGGALRVAVIDTEKILLSSVAGKKAIAELKKAQEAKEGELRAKQQEIKELQDKLSQGRLTLAQDKLTEMSKQARGQGDRAAPPVGRRDARAQQAEGRPAGRHRREGDAGDQPDRP